MAQDRAFVPSARQYIAVAGLLGLSLLSCGREPTGPGAGLRVATGLSFLAEFPGPLASITSGAGSVVPFDRVRVLFRRTDNTVALDSLVPFPSNADSVALALSVPLSSSAPSTGEPMTLSLAYVNSAGDTVFRGGPVPIVAQVRAAGSPPPEPASVPLAYVGPGANATRVTVGTDTIALVAGDAFTVTAVARDAQGAPIANTPLLFSSLDGAHATLASPASGAGVTTSLRGTSRIRVQLLTGAAEDTATIIAAPRPGTLAVLSGGAQTASAGALLGQPIVVRLLATDGQPLAGATVTYTVASGGGIVTPLGTVTDSLGRVSFTWTLGASAGTQSVTVSSAGVTPLTVSATAQAVQRTLVITQELGTSYAAGDSLPALLAEVRGSGGVRDTTFTDSVGIAIVAGPAGATLTGPARVAAAAGLARFDNLRLTKAGSGYRLQVSAGGVTPDTSAAIGITARAASVLALASGGGQSAAPGAALAQPVVVRIADAYDNPVAGTIVLFSTLGGTLSAAADTSDAAGLASSAWTLGTTVGTQSLVVTAGALGGSPLTVTATATGNITSTTLAPTFDTLTAIGATRLLTATSRNGANTVVPGNYTWLSRDTSIAAVNDSGRVAAKKDGQTWIVATESGGTRDSARIVVQQRLASIRVTPDPRAIYLGASYPFTAQAVDGLNVPLVTQPSFVWSTASSAIASITAGGVATGVGLGQTQVRATAGSVTGTAALTVRTPITRIAVVRDSVGFVTSDSFSLAALGRTRSYKAVAYDTLDAVMPGITFTWASSNPSVASLDSTGTVTARAVAVANGFTAVRASAQGVTGAAALTVAQVMTAIDLTPSSASVAPTGAVVLTARRRDAGGAFIPGGTFTFASANASVATVTNAGVVTGVLAGVTSITARSVTATNDTITSTAATITVTDSVPAVISFGRDTVAIGRSATNAPIPVYLSRPHGSAVTVNLAVADTFAFFNPTSITIAAGSTVGTATLNGRNAGSTRIFAVDGGSTGFAGDTAVLAVQAGVRFASTSYNLLVNDEVGTQVILTDPAPTGGSYITYAFGTPGRISVAPDPAFIPAGQLSANVVIRALAAGGSTVTPSATGVSGTASSVSTQAAVLTMNPSVARLGTGQYDNGSYISTPLSVNNGFAVTLTSSDSTIVSTASTTIPSGSYYGYFPLRGLRTGAVTVSASANGWTAPSPRAVTVTTPHLYLAGGGTITTTNPEFGLTVYATDSTGSAHYRMSALSVALTSSDTAVVRLVAPTTTIGADQYYTSNIRAVPGGTPGTAWIRVSASGHTPDSVQYTVNGPNLRIAMSVSRLGTGQYDAGSYVYVPNTVTQPVLVRLTSSAPGVATVTDSVFIPANSYYAYVTLRGLTPGSTRLNVSAAGYAPDSSQLTVTSPRIVVSGGGTFNNYAPPVGFTVYAADSVGNAHYVLDTLRLTYASSDTAIIKVTAADTIRPGQYYTSNGRVSFVGEGSAWVRVTAPGYFTDSIRYTVQRPRVAASFDTYRIGRRQYRLPTDFYVYVPNNVADTLTVTVTQTNAAIDSLTATTLRIPRGTYYAYFGLAGLATGVDTLIVSAPGYFSDTAVVQVTSPRITGGSIPGSATTTTPPSQTTIYLTDSLGSAHYSLDTLLFAATSSNASVVQPDSIGFRLPRGAYYVQPRFRYTGPGTATLTWRDSLNVGATGFGSLTSNSVTVTGPSLQFYNSRPILGMRQYGLGTGAYVQIPNAIGTPLTVRLLATDTTVATVPDSVVIPAGQTYAYVDVRAQSTVGTIQLQATATGYASASTTQQVTQPKFTLSIPTALRTTQSPAGFTIYATDANGSAHYVWEPVTVTLTSSNPGAATVDSATVTIPTGSYYSGNARIVPVAAGTTTITASDARVQSYRYDAAAAAVAVTTPALQQSWGTSPLKLGIDQWTESHYVYVPDNQPAPLTVTTSHATSASATAATVTIPQGTYYVYHRITGVTAGVDTITYTAAGHTATTGAVSVGLGRVDGIGGWPTTLASDSVAVTLYARDPDGNVRNVSVATTFALAVSGSALEARVNGAAVTSVTIPANAQSVTFYLRRLANGTATVTFTNTNYATHISPTVTVSGVP